VQASQTSEEAILSRLQKFLKKSNGPGSPYSLSLSVGVARFDPKKAVTLGELLAQADEAMYEKKRKSKLVAKAGI
jgi:GGDEF domain-containing protein